MKVVWWCIVFLNGGLFFAHLDQLSYLNLDGDGSMTHMFFSLLCATLAGLYLIQENK